MALAMCHDESLRWEVLGPEEIVSDTVLHRNLGDM
jgi:hypothetical protein